MSEETTDIIDVVEAPADVEETVTEEITATDTEEAESIDLEADETAEKADTDEAEEEGAEDEAPEMVEFDFGGNKLEIPKGSVPPELADKITEFTQGTWSKFTKDQQANAETAKSLAARETALQTMEQINGDVQTAYSKGLQLRNEIEQLSQVDLRIEWQSNPDRARQISDTLAAKQAEFQNIVGQVGQYETSLSQAQQQERERLSAEGRAVLDQKIKGFSTEKAPELVKHVVENYGMSQEDAEQWDINPTVTEMAYKAMLYDRMQASAKKPQAKPTQAKPVKPMKAKGSATGSSSDPNKMSTSEMAKYLGIAS